MGIEDFYAYAFFACGEKRVCSWPAVERAVELAKIRGVKIHGFFETAVAYVAHCYKPLPAIDASTEVGF